MLLDKITPDETLVSCEESIDKMIHHLNLIKDDLTDKHNSEDVNSCSLKVRLIGFNTLNKVFQDYMLQLNKENF